MSDNERKWLKEHLDYIYTLPTYNEAFPVVELIYRHFGAMPCFPEVIREVDKVKRLFRNGDSLFRGMPATPNNMPPPALAEYVNNPYIQKAIRMKILDDGGKPKGLSTAQQGRLADLLAKYMKLSNTWKYFGEKWGVDSETLRSYFNKPNNKADDWIKKLKLL